MSGQERVEQTAGMLKRLFEMSLLGLNLTLSFDFYEKNPIDILENVIKMLGRLDLGESLLPLDNTYLISSSSNNFEVCKYSSLPTTKGCPWQKLEMDSS